MSWLAGSRSRCRRLPIVLAPRRPRCIGEFDAARRDHELALDRGRATGDRHAEWQALLDLGMLWAERDYERTIGYYRAALDPGARDRRQADDRLQPEPGRQLARQSG